jgi:hypothetical protein
LEGVVLNFLYVLDFEERLLSLDITLAVPIVKGEHMVGAGCEYHVSGGILTPPDFTHDMVSELTLQESFDLKHGDQVQSISVLKVLIQQQVLHLVFMVDLGDVLLDNAGDSGSQGLSPSLQLMEPVSDSIKDFNQQAGTLNWVQINHKDVRFVFSYSGCVQNL